MAAKFAMTVNVNAIDSQRCVCRTHLLQLIMPPLKGWKYSESSDADLRVSPTIFQPERVPRFCFSCGFRDYRTKRVRLFAICCSSAAVRGRVVRKISQPLLTLPPGGERSDP